MWVCHPSTGVISKQAEVELCSQRCCVVRCFTRWVYVCPCRQGVTPNRERFSLAIAFPPRFVVGVSSSAGVFKPQHSRWWTSSLASSLMIHNKPWSSMTALLHGRQRSHDSVSSLDLFLESSAGWNAVGVKVVYLVSRKKCCCLPRRGQQSRPPPVSNSDLRSTLHLCVWTKRFTVRTLLFNANPSTVTHSSMLENGRAASAIIWG